MTGFKNMKFAVKDAAQSAALQKMLFGLGYDWEFPSYKGAVQPSQTGELLASSAGILYTGVWKDDGYETVDTAAFLAEHTKPAAKSLEDAYDFLNTGNLEAALYEPNGCPWMENTVGLMPVADGFTKLDAELRDGSLPSGCLAHNFRWSLEDEAGDVIKWRYHNASDYYKAPKTPASISLKPEHSDTVTPAEVLSWSIPVQPSVARNKYSREIKPGVFCDVYDVLRAFAVTDGALAHLVKKALAVGQRGHKDAAEDYKDIVDSAIRAQELNKEWN